MLHPHPCRAQALNVNLACGHLSSPHLLSVYISSASVYHGKFSRCALVGHLSSTLVHMSQQGGLSPGQDGGRQAHIVAQRLGAVVAAADRVGRCQDGCPGIQCGLHAIQIMAMDPIAWAGHLRTGMQLLSSVLLDDTQTPLLSS